MYLSAAFHLHPMYGLAWGSDTRESLPFKFIVYVMKEVWFNFEAIEGHFILDDDLPSSRFFLIPVGPIFWMLSRVELQLLTPLSVFTSTGANKNGQRGRKNFHPHFLQLSFKNKASKRKKDLSHFIVAITSTVFCPAYTAHRFQTQVTRKNNVF
jgi:hypothetical protein